MSKIKALRNGTKKEAITRKAAVLFRKKGYNASSMRELAENIGVEAPSLYNHIGSKNELLTSICFGIGAEYNDNLVSIETTNECNTWKLQEIIRFHIRMMINKYDEVFVVNHEWKQMQQPHLSEFILQRKNYEAGFLKIIEQGIQSKEFRNIQPYVAVLTILSSVRGLEIWQRHKKNLPAEILEEHMIQHLLFGLIK